MTEVVNRRIIIRIQHCCNYTAASAAEHTVQYSTQEFTPPTPLEAGTQTKHWTCDEIHLLGTVPYLRIQKRQPDRASSDFNRQGNHTQYLTRITTNISVPPYKQTKPYPQSPSQLLPGGERRTQKPLYSIRTANKKKKTKRSDKRKAFTMAPPSPLTIAAQAVQRLVKEESYYHKEQAQQEARIKKLQDAIEAKDPDLDSNAEYVLRQEVCSCTCICLCIYPFF